MRIIGNLLWWLFGGLEAAIGYFTGSLALACTIIGIPWGKQHFKMAGLSLARQLHIYRNGKKILILAGKAQPKIMGEDKLNKLIN